MTAQRRRLISIVAGIGVSVVLLWILFRDIDFGELYAALRGANYYWLIPYVFLIVASMYLRASRWSSMIRPVKEVAYSKLLAATCIGFMANNVLPLRLGEFVRAYSLSYQDREVSKSASMATIFVERMVFDLVALLVILGAVIAVTTVHISEEMKAGIWVAIGIALGGLTMVLLLARRPEQAGELLTRYLFFLPERIKEGLKGIVYRFGTGLQFITQFKATASVGLQTLLIWIIMGGSNYFVMCAFDLPLPLDASYFLLVVVSIWILMPSSPGFVGVYHAAVVFALSKYPGVGGEEARAFALVLHAAQYIPITVMGFYYLRKEHLSLRQLETEAVDQSHDD